MKLTQKQEKFTLNLFKGLSQREAYIQAGYSSNQLPATIDRHAYELANTDKILARFNELREAAKNAAIADVEERKQILTEIARGRLTDYVTCGPDRDLIDVGSESPNTAAFQEITSRTEVDKDGAGVAVITKLKLHSSISAIDTLNKMDKIYSENTVNIDNRKVEIIVSSDEARQLTDKILKGENT